MFAEHQESCICKIHNVLKHQAVRQKSQEHVSVGELPLHLETGRYVGIDEQDREIIIADMLTEVGYVLRRI